MRTAHFFFAFALAAPLALVSGASAQTPQEFVAACDAESDDVLAQRACYARALTDVEVALAETVNAMRTAVSERVEAPDRRRSAVAAIDSAQSAWRLLRDHDCAYEAAIAPAANDQSRVQMTCAIARTQARRVALADDAPTPAPVETAVETSPEDDLAPALARVAVRSEAEFRDWRGSCTTDGVCAATTSAQGEDAALILRIERGDPREDWRLLLLAPATPARPGDPIRLTVDEREPITFHPERDVAIGAMAIELLAPLKSAEAFVAMQAGIELTAEFTDAEGVLHTEQVSLRGMSAALDWGESEQESLSH